MWHLNSLSGVSADHSTVDYDYAAGMEDVDSHLVIDSRNAEDAGCGSTD